MPQELDARGLPVKTDYPAMPVPAMYAMFSSVLGSMGVGIGFAIYKFGATSKFDGKIDALAKNDLGWVYLGLAALKQTQFLINVNLGVNRKEAKINVPDQQVYKAHGATTYVLMEQEGALGCFNRAQRALQNYLEQLPGFLAFFFSAGYVFPFPTFVMTLLFGGCRVSAAVGYTKAAKERMAGNIASSLVMETFQGLVLLAGVKALLRKERSGHRRRIRPTPVATAQYQKV
eukprot:CAMPEP_0183434090 /NCGR_PEP_ID=MMETSP0370-20130417/61807_1 /TAXON_ID=268820 /ORGANISM="Peridinium aciculiferum, Strain PAER-2" /LENGTH=230 /DNA_ID=CAMNT_0025620589 /DNA_START=66 /DNA_END=756 /DNA_ORIENTATION=+